MYCLSLSLVSTEKDLLLKQITTLEAQLQETEASLDETRLSLSKRDQSLQEQEGIVTLYMRGHLWPSLRKSALWKILPKIFYNIIWICNVLPTQWYLKRFNPTYYCWVMTSINVCQKSKSQCFRIFPLHSVGVATLKVKHEEEVLRDELLQNFLIIFMQTNASKLVQSLCNCFFWSHRPAFKCVATDNPNINSCIFRVIFRVRIYSNNGKRCNSTKKAKFAPLRTSNESLFQRASSSTIIPKSPR